MAVAVRRPAVAGTFYPSQPERLRAEVEACIGEPAAIPGLVAVVAPHAGYAYSGPVAGTAFAAVAARRDSVRRVVLVGPSHFVAVRGVAACSASTWETPLGSVAVDGDLQSAALAAGAVVDDAAHHREHSLEVELPFLQVAVGRFEVLPLAVGDATNAEVADVLGAVWTDASTLVVVSTDLSHYHDHATATAIDAGTAAAICELRPHDIADTCACGARPLRGLLTLAAERDLDVTLLDLRTSGDTAGSRDRVVGYGAFAFSSS